MAEKRRRRLTDNQRKQAGLRVAAVRAAESVLTQHTTLRGADADRVAQLTVTAATPSIRAEQVRQMGGMSQPELVAALTLSVGTLIADLVLLGMVAARGPRTVRIFAAGVAGLHVGLVTYAHDRQGRIRDAARRQLRGDA